MSHVLNLQGMEPPQVPSAGPDSVTPTIWSTASVTVVCIYSTVSLSLC